MEILPTPSPNKPSSQGGFHKGFFILFLFIIGFLLLIARSVRERHLQKKEVDQTTKILAVPTVLVVQPELSQPEIKLQLPGDVKPYAETPIYARTDGYLKRWMVDIGTPVKEGELLAEIESPEVDQQYNQAVGSLQQAQAQLKLAIVTAARWKEMLDRNTIARQDSDQKQADLEVAQANVVAAEAAVSRLQKMKDFEQVTAPFSGMITQRNINIGDLISSSNTTNQKPLFEIVDDTMLRIYVNVPESVANQIKIGQQVPLKLASFPGEEIMGTLTRTSDKIDQASRTLLTEIQVPNADHRLMTGGYATVHLPIPMDRASFFLPVNTLLFRPEGTFVGVVNEKGIVELRKIKIGKDYGTRVQVVQGLEPTDRVILNPSDSLESGNAVLVAPPKTTKK